MGVVELEREFEEVLESVWMGDEKKICALSEINKICHIVFEDRLLKKMQQEGLVAHDDDNIYFTEKGKKLAKGLIRRKRLAEELLEHVLNIRGDRADEIACEFEHAVIPEVEESICILLGHPAECPHGLPIPPGPCCSGNKNNISQTVSSITQYKVGDSVKISYIRPTSHSRLHKLSGFGLRPGTVIKIHQKKPSFILMYENTEIAMDQDIASNIYGWKKEEAETSG